MDNICENGGMTFARWSEQGFDKDYVASSLAKGINPLPSGGLQYSGDAFFGEPVTLLETGVEFLEPIPETDRHRIIRISLERALRSSDYGSSALIREINKAARDFVRSPEKKYVMSTFLSFEHTEDLNRMDSSGARVYIREGLPPYLSRSHQEAKTRSKNVVRGDYPEESTSHNYTAAWVHVRGRSGAEAMDRAFRVLDLRRGMWNYALNRKIIREFAPPNRGPRNEILAGPVYSLHHPDGTLATQYDWYDPDYTGPQFSRKLLQKGSAKWDEILRDEEGISRLLKRSLYRETLEDALRRYCRALDSPDLYNAFLSLWGVLETLTNIGPGEGHDKLVERAANIYHDRDRKTQQQVLHHLRRHRNAYVHAGENSDQSGTYLDQLRGHVEKLMLFHLRNSSKFSSLNDVASFLDLPGSVKDIEYLIRDRKRKADEVKNSTRLAEKGLRFRGGSTT